MRQTSSRKSISQAVKESETTHTPIERKHIRTPNYSAITYALWPCYKILNLCKNPWFPVCWFCELCPCGLLIHLLSHNFLFILHRRSSLCLKFGHGPQYLLPTVAGWNLTGHTDNNFASLHFLNKERAGQTDPSPGQRFCGWNIRFGMSQGLLIEGEI